MAGRIVAAVEAARIRDSAPGRHFPLLDALLGGEVVHFDDLVNHFNASHLRKVHSVRLRTRRVGGGCYYWVEPL